MVRNDSLDSFTLKVFKLIRSCRPLEATVGILCVWFLAASQTGSMPHLEDKKVVVGGPNTSFRAQLQWRETTGANRFTRASECRVTHLPRSLSILASSFHHCSVVLKERRAKAQGPGPGPGTETGSDAYLLGARQDVILFPHTHTTTRFIPSPVFK